jgi:diguanylate cyclase (GGDEF)-like protein
MGLPASAVLAMIVGTAVPLAHRVIFVGFVWIADVVCFVAAGSYLRRRATGELITQSWPGAVAVGLIGFAWGSLALVGLPSAEHDDLRAIYLLFVCAVASTYVVGTAARRLYFYAATIPLFVPVLVVFVSSTDRSTRLLGLAVPIYFVVMATMHHEVHSVVVSEIGLRGHNDLTNAELRTANDRLARQALHDHLTGLANRVCFIDSVKHAIAASEHLGVSVAVLYLDLDWFKVINDSLGHNTGDGLLIRIADRIKSVTRNGDLVARFGGDEFVILCRDMATHDEAVVMAERVMQALWSPFVVDGRTVNISASIGVAVCAHPTDTADGLVSNADAAQYQAKQNGRNRIEVFDRHLRDGLLHQLDEEQQLRHALSTNEILAWYQPIVDLGNGRIVGAEALARWNHPSRGILDAYKFVPVAEQTGLILDLDDRVIADALSARAQLRDKVGDAFRVWVNISAKQFGRTNPTQRLAALLDRVRCDPETIGIEITETAVLNDLDAAAREVHAARKLGVRVALDDFGIGHSSLTLLRNLPLDEVKIDRSFVANIEHNARDRAIVSSVSTLARDLGLAVIAEGVETPEQAHLVRELGCGYGQGWLWAKALPLDQLLQHTQAANATPNLTLVSNNAHS